MSTPFDVDGQKVFTSAVIGITVSTTGYERPEELLQDAAIALHRAKSGTRVAYELFDPRCANARSRACSRDRSAERHRQRGDPVLYQPIISLATGAIKGFEALARWHHPCAA